MEIEIKMRVRVPARLWADEVSKQLVEMLPFKRFRCRNPKPPRDPKGVGVFAGLVPLKVFRSPGGDSGG